MRKEFFCVTCKKFVTDVRTEVGAMMPPGPGFVFGEASALVCRECGSAVMELTRMDGKGKKRFE